MPEKATLRKAKEDKREGKSASTQAGEFVHEEIEHIRHGKHGARSAKQAIAIGLSKARRAGVKLPVPAKGKASAATRSKAKHDLEKGTTHRKPSAKRSKAETAALKREGHAAASTTALSRQATKASAKRSVASKKASAAKAVKTKGAAGRHRAAVKGVKTRAAR